jgi:hypothetical protein
MLIYQAKRLRKKLLKGRSNLEHKNHLTLLLVALQRRVNKSNKTTLVINPNQEHIAFTLSE